MYPFHWRRFPAFTGLHGTRALCHREIYRGLKAEDFDPVSLSRPVFQDIAQRKGMRTVIEAPCVRHTGESRIVKRVGLLEGSFKERTVSAGVGLEDGCSSLLRSDVRGALVASFHCGLREYVIQAGVVRFYETRKLSYILPFLPDVSR